jgi:hypothetical protein
MPFQLVRLAVVAALALLTFRAEAQTRPAKPKASPPASAKKGAAEKRPAVKDFDDTKWETVQGDLDGVKFSLKLPPEWKWKKDNEANKQVSFSCTIDLNIKEEELEGKEKGDSPQAAAKKLLADLTRADELRDEKLRELRIIKLGETDAVWTARIVTDDKDRKPTLLETQCYIHHGGKRFVLVAGRFDVRQNRTEKDFADSLAEFLAISKTFRIQPAKPAENRK